jgi:hypothetical protein
VFYLRATFGTGVETAVIESPIYNAKSSVCLTFYYIISSPAIVLNILNKTTSNKELVASFSYSDRLNLMSWNKAFVLLQYGVVQLKFSAEKFALTASPQFVIVDRISLKTSNTCQPTGKLNTRN